MRARRPQEMTLHRRLTTSKLRRRIRAHLHCCQYPKEFAILRGPQRQFLTQNRAVTYDKYAPARFFVEPRICNPPVPSRRAGAKIVQNKVSKKRKRGKHTNYFFTILKELAAHFPLYSSDMRSHAPRITLLSGYCHDVLHLKCASFIPACGNYYPLILNCSHCEQLHYERSE